jgi:tungstate transport system substrate-binding protein
MKELALWEAAGVSPRGERWYLESGASQAATLRIADERGAYALADLPVLAHVQGISLRILFTADTTLLNPYTLYIVHQTPEHPDARRFAAWAVEVWRGQLAVILLPDGTAAFTPRAGGCVATARP